MNHENPKAAPREHHVPTLWEWKWEIVAIVTSLGLLAGILATLARYNDGRQPDWPYNININSLVSVLTAVIIAQLGFILAESTYDSLVMFALLGKFNPARRPYGLDNGISQSMPAVISQLKWSWFRQPHPLQHLEYYDAASRGMLGSFVFLGRFARQRRAMPPSYLATGAAFSLIMSAAIGPFTQQSIKSYACQRPLHNISASIPIASYVNSSQVVGYTPQSQFRMHPDLKMMTAALEGIIGPANNIKTVPFDCPTGDCDFPPYSSLSYCSSCTDITSSVQQDWGPDYYDPDMLAWRYTLPGQYLYSGGGSLPAQDCQLTFKDIKGHPHFRVDPMTEDFDPDHLIICSDMSSHQTAFNLTILSMSWANCSHDTDKAYSGNPSCDSYPDQLPSLANTSGLVAMNCTLGLCVGDYTSRVRNGVLEETMTSSLSPNLMSHEASLFEMLRLPCTIESNKYDLSNISQVPIIPGRNFTTVSVEGRNVTAPLECVFATVDSVPWAINSFVQGYLIRPQSLKKWPTCKMDFNEGDSFCDPWYLEPLFHGSRPTAATILSDMAGLAVAISNRIRVVGSNAYRNGSGVALGTAIQTTVCVRVDWPWLAFPTALVVLTLVLFVAVIVKARHAQIADGQPIWKSSAVVAFFHGLDSRSHTPESVDRDPAHHVRSADELEGRPASALLIKGDSNEASMTLKSMHAKAKKELVKLETATTGQRRFIVVDQELDERRTNCNKHHVTDARRHGGTSPPAKLPSNGSLDEQPPTYLQVDLGVGLSPSIRSSLDRSFHHCLDDSSERET